MASPTDEMLTAGAKVLEEMQHPGATVYIGAKPCKVVRPFTFNVETSHTIKPRDEFRWVNLGTADDS